MAGFCQCHYMDDYEKDTKLVFTLSEEFALEFESTGTIASFETNDFLFDSNSL